MYKFKPQYNSLLYPKFNTIRKILYKNKKTNYNVLILLIRFIYFILNITIFLLLPLQLLYLYLYRIIFIRILFCNEKFRI